MRTEWVRKEGKRKVRGMSNKGDGNLFFYGLEEGYKDLLITMAFSSSPPNPSGLPMLPYASPKAGRRGTGVRLLRRRAPLPLSLLM